MLYLCLMIQKQYNRTNFHKHTFCVFAEMPLELIAELKPNFRSKSGSSYYFTEQGVYRLSNHWSRVANCRWRLEANLELQLNLSKTKLGYAKWTDFFQDNDNEKLYFIRVDFENKTAQFFHKASSNYDSTFVLRTASETMKTIQQIRKLLAENAWAKYLIHDDIEVIRQEIIQKLITTATTFQDIRRNYLR